jgi:hypothetical protein
LLTQRNNPYLDAMVIAANKDLKKVDIVWLRATPDSKHLLDTICATVYGITHD